MPIAEPYTNTATIGVTPFSLPNNSTTLTPITVDGVFQVWIDFSALTVTESYEVAVTEKITSGGSARDVFTAVIGGTIAQSLVTPSLILLHGWDVQVTKLAGTDRSISWSIRQVA